MNRNVESHFSTVPTVDLPRSTFEIPFTHKTTANCGDLIPFYCLEVLPGDSHRITTSKVVRLQTMLNPIMDNIYLDTYFFFVPNRLVWEHWQNFMGESDKAWLPSATYTIPMMKSNTTDDEIKVGMLADYFGWPVGIDGVTGSALPFRSYHLIWDAFFRDPSYQDPLNIYFGDSNKYFNAYNANDDLTEKYPWPRKAARYHDYFSSVLPAPQRGPDVPIPFEGQLPVITTNDDHGQADPVQMLLEDKANATRYPYLSSAAPSAVDVYSSAQSTRNWFYPTNLWATTAEGYGPGYAELTASINDLRMAFQIQRMYEKDALYGDRYISILKGHFGVSNGDARLQRPEYLGGNRIALNVHEVVNTTEGDSSFLGNLGAMSHTSDVHEDFIKSFTESGYIIGVMVARYDNSYAQGLERFWSRKNRFDFYWPSLAHIGNQAVLNQEIFYQADNGANASDNAEVWGYQEAWADYRYKPNLVTGEMRPGVTGSLASWHLSDYYQQLPVMSGDWLATSEDIVDRVLAVDHTNAKQYFCDIFVRDIATRVMPLYSVPGLIDHF